MAIMGSVMKLLTGAVQEVVGRITQQLNILQTLQGQFGGFASTLQSSWIGEDADAFVAEVQRRLLPEIADLIAAIAGMPGGLNRGVELIHSADSKGRSMVASLGDMFGSIF